MGLRDAIDDELGKISQSASQWIAKFVEPEVRKVVRVGNDEALVPFPSQELPDGITAEIFTQILQENFQVFVTCGHDEGEVEESPGGGVAWIRLFNCGEKSCNGVISHIRITWWENDC